MATPVTRARRPSGLAWWLGWTLVAAVIVGGITLALTRGSRAPVAMSTAR